MNQDSGAITKISPVGRLSLEKAAAIKDQLLAALGAGGRVALDLSRIEEIDLSFVQMVYAARREALARGCRFELAGRVSDQVLQLLRIGGFIKEGSADARELEAELHNFPRGA